MMLKKVYWQDIREVIKTMLPEFTNIVDEINPDKKYPLYLVDYPYGATILDHSILHIPNKEGHIVPLKHSSISQVIKEDLGYCGTIPLGIVLENSIETFILARQRIVPASLMKPGQFVSLWRVLDEGVSFNAGSFWNFTAGSRSICMLPKITDANGYKAIKSTLGIDLRVPQQLSDHWKMFVKIASRPQSIQPWKSTVLYFTKQWLAHKKDDAWRKFYYYLLNTVWQNASFRRNQFVLDFVFSLAQENKNLRSNPYLADTVRYLIAVGSGSSPAFAPAIDNTAAPINELQQVFLENYGLKKYCPTIMHLHHFSAHEDRPVYYSFQLPTTNIFSPKSRKLSSTMVELHELQHIMETFLSEIIKGKLEVENTPLFDLAKNVRYCYYHTEKDKHKEILLSSEIHTLDSNFTKTTIDDNIYAFPEFAPFFRGCVSISNAT